MKLTFHIIFFVLSHFLYNSMSVIALCAQIRPDFVLADSAVHPSIKIDEDGNLYAVWKKITQSFVGEQPIYFAIFDSLGINTQPPVRVSIDNEALNPRLSLSGDYVTIVWWTRSATFNDHIHAHSFIINNSIQLGGMIFNSSYGDAQRGFPEVSYLSDTTFIVVWQGEGPETRSDFGVYGQISTNALDFYGGNILLTDHGITDVTHGWVRVAARPTWNDFLAVWRDDQSGSRRVYGRFFSFDGSPVDSSFLISEDPELTDMWFLSVAVNERGEFGVVWGGQIDSIEWVVQLRLLGSDGTPLSPSIQVNFPDAANEPVGNAITDIAFDKDGTFVIVWEHKVNGVSYIYAQRFLEDGSFLGSNFKVSTSEDTLHQGIPGVVLRNRKIYTSWSSGRKMWANIIDFYNPPVSVEKEETTMSVSSFYLHQNFPNPFNPVATIEYSLTYSGEVRLVIYNLIGEEVTRLVDGEMPAGNHTVIWNASDFASGIYFYRLQAGDFVRTRKMVLLK